jgi:ATP-dependent HslUV protease, peptidase subunit HslV
MTADTSRAQPEARSMTTIVVVRKGDEIAIAADSLTTFGDTRLAAVHDRTYDKIVQYRGSYVGLCGSAAHQLVFDNLLKKHDDLDLTTKSAVFETFRKLHPILKEQHFLNPKEEDDDPYESTQVTALIANEHGIFGVYSMREVFEYTQFWAAGSGREFALGAMHAQYPRLRTAGAIAKAGVEAGALFDKNSALPMTLYTVKALAA